MKLHCCGCHKEFSVGDKVYLLSISAYCDLDKDYCEDCWVQQPASHYIEERMFLYDTIMNG